MGKKTEEIAGTPTEVRTEGMGENEGAELQAATRTVSPEAAGPNRCETTGAFKPAAYKLESGSIRRDR